MSSGDSNASKAEASQGRPTPSRSLDDFLALAASESKRPLEYYAIFLSLGVANSSDASEILCLSYILSEENFRQTILHNTEWTGGILAATVFLGMLVGGLLVGAWGDRKGRRPTLLIGLATNCIGGILASMAPNLWALMAVRLIAGIGIGATVPPLFTLCSELSPPTDRGFWVTVAASFWMVGSIYVAVVGWMLLAALQASWRTFALACAVPSAAGWLLVYRRVPESPRFLALQGQVDRATLVTNKLADSMHYTGAPLTRAEVLEQYPASVDEETPVVHEMPDADSLRQLLQSAWKDFLASSSQLYTVELSQTTISLQTVWFSLSFGSYGLLTWINTLFFAVHLQNVYFNALLFALSNLPGNILSAVLMDRVGRARLLTGSVLAAALSLIVFAYVAYADQDAQETEAVSRNWIVAAACAFQCFTIVAWNSIDVLTSELFPTTVRATGMGVCAASGRVGAMLAQFINGSLVGKPVRLVLVAAATLLLGAFTPVFLPGDQTGQPVSDRLENVQRRSSSLLWQHEPGGLSLPDRQQAEDRRYSYQPVQGSGEQVRYQVS